MKHRCKDVKLEWFCVWIGLVALFSCESNQLGTDYVGKLRLSLIADTTSLSKGVNGVTKAVNAGEFDAFLTTSDYRISILQEADTMHVYERFDEMPAEVELKEGAYTLIAEKGNNLPAAFENPYFAGSVDFSIRADMSTPIDVTCTLANARITVEYTDDFKEAYSDYTVLLSSAFTSNDLEIAKGETRPAYVQVAKEGSELGVAIRLKKVNEEEEKTYHVPTPLSIERRQNIRLIFKTDGAALEGIGLEVLLDDELTELTLNEGIPDFMWKPFEKPTLSAIDFQDGEEIKISGTYEKNPTIGFVMPAGISSLCIKLWREDQEEEVIYDLATNEGVDAATKKGFHWSVNDIADKNVSGERGKGLLFLQNAISSLEAPSEEGKNYTYHWEFFGKDATGKQQETNTLRMTIVVLPAGVPLITFNGILETTIVEGDAMPVAMEAHYKADGIIDEGKTTLVINDETYRILPDSATLRSKWGISVKSDNVKTATVTFPKEFSTLLEAPEEGEKTYTFTLHLEDEKGKSAEEVKTQLTVQAPEFTLQTTEGDAFAKRIVLRADLMTGNKEHLFFQYQEEGSGDSWTDVPANLNVEGIQCVDTIKGLTASTEDITSRYCVRAVYQGAKQWFSEAVTVTMETPGSLPNGGLEEWSIAPDANGNTDPGADVELNWDDLADNVPSPYRCWEIWQPYITTETVTWNTLNILTTSAGGLRDGDVSEPSRKWTRYVANSGTIRTDGVSGYGALIRTVGWGEGNSAAGDLSSIKYCTPGELYLGTYDTEAHYGIPFASRPSGFSFMYKYSRKNTDAFIAEIVVLNQEGEEIARADMPSIQVSDNWVSGSVRLKYAGDKKQEKAAHMYIRFVSGTSTSTDDFMIRPAFSNLSNGEYVGSQLYIDNIQLIYE